MYAAALSVGVNWNEDEWVRETLIIVRVEIHTTSACLQSA